MSSIEKLKSEVIIPETINRFPDLNKTETCSCCNSNYDKKEARHCFNNYGGTIKKMSYCSTDCVDFVVSINPKRISKQKSKLRNLTF